VAEGDTVAEGQTLATIDTLRLEAARLEAEASLAQADASLAAAEAAADGSTASDAKIAAAEAQVEVAAANLATAEANMADAVLIAPAAGQITAVGVAVGDMVGSSSSAGGSGGAGAAKGAAAQTSAGSSTAAFTIVGTESWSIDLRVSDSDLALLEVGGQAEITVGGVTETVFGVIASLGRVATTSGGSATFPVVVEVTGQPEGLFDGLSATVELIYERRLDVLTVPVNAVRTVDGVAYVDKMVDSVATQTEVAVGETAGSLIEITSGLAEGDEVQITVAVTTGSSGSSGSSGSGEQGEDERFQMVPGGGQMPFGDMGGDMGGAPGGGGFQMGGGGMPNG
jgi:macrolide-specific efflux system membrane fusion protein